MITIGKNDLFLTIAPEIGGSIVRFWSKKGDFELNWLRKTDDETIKAGDAANFSSFPLVPFSNRIKNSEFYFNGKSIKLSRNMDCIPYVIHGHGYRKSWNVVEHHESKAILEYKHTPDEWPYAYTIRQFFEITDDELLIDFEIINDGKEDMPYGLGHHFFFPRTPETMVSAKIDKIWTSDEEVMPKDLITPDDEHNLSYGVLVDKVNMDNTFSGWSGEATIDWPEFDAKLHLRADNEMGFLVVFCPKDDKFVCVEPVSNRTDAFNAASDGDKTTGTLILQPSEKKKITISLTPEIYKED
jgi:aldose 1-epimerase